MASGEYLATKSQDEILNAELDLERIHLRDHRQKEVDQLREMFGDMGVAEADLDGVVAAFDRSDEAMLNAMAALEFGVVASERRSPWLAMTASGLLFLAGSLPSIVPFLVFEDTGAALTWATVFALSGLFVVGVIKARVAKGNWLVSGAENVVIAGIGGLAAWAIGNAIGATLG